MFKYLFLSEYWEIYNSCFTPHEIWQLYIEWVYYSNVISTVEKQ